MTVAVLLMVPVTTMSNKAARSGVTNMKLVTLLNFFVSDIALVHNKKPKALGKVPRYNTTANPSNGAEVTSLIAIGVTKLNSNALATML